VFARYARQGSTLVILYVEAPPPLRGTGAASQLMVGGDGGCPGRRAEGEAALLVCGRVDPAAQRIPRPPRMRSIARGDHRTDRHPAPADMPGPQWVTLEPPSTPLLRLPCADLRCSRIIDPARRVSLASTIAARESDVAAAKVRKPECRAGLVHIEQDGRLTLS